jgi:hypothetical protein
MKVQTLSTWEEFAYFWQATQIKQIDNYFINTESGEFKKYKFGSEERKIDSISLFKDAI